MKLRYIFCALLSALLFAACTDDDEIGSLDSIQIDKTYVSIPVAGGDATITITASGAWQFDQVFNLGSKDEPNYQALPAWLTADVLSGANGESRVTFHADATEGGREAELQISAGGKKQFVIVRQGSLDPTEATIAEVLAGPAGPSYRVKGVISRWYSNYEQYGNFYLKDATGEIIVYGTADKDGKLKNYPIKSWGLDIGDEVTIEGGTSQYKGVNQFVDVTIIEVKKSLVKIESAPNTVSKAGGDVEVKVSYKGAGAYFSIPEADRSWISYLDSKYISGEADTVVFRFRVAPNEGSARQSELTFTSANSEAESVVTCTISQETAVAHPATGNGTAASPYNVTAALDFTKALGADVKSTDDVYVMGIISSIKYTYSAQYGTATYNISCDGKEENVFTVYSSLFFDNQPWQEGSTQIQLGDEVVVCGKVIYYGGTTPEFASKENWLVKLNGKTGEGDAPALTSLDVDFKANGQGDWTVKDLVALGEGISYVWNYDSNYGMKASAYVSGTRYETDSWLISPALNLPNGATLTFSHVQRYGSGSDLHVMASTTYGGGAVNPAEWTEISIDQWPDGSNWNFITSTGTVPAGDNVTIAFRYTSTTKTAATWEIESLSVK